MIRFPLIFGLVCILTCLTGTAAVQAQIAFSAEGQVGHPGTHSVEAGTRLSAGILRAAPNDSTYLLGAQLLRQSSVLPQQRLKAGLLHDLRTLQRQRDTEEDLLALAARLERWLEQLPVTGRTTLPLDPRRLELQRLLDTPIESGDQLHFTARPDAIMVVGAVTANCTLPHRPLEEAAHAANRCARAAVADRDHVFLIQPDGQVQDVPIALWNKEGEQALAPGAVIYVPIRSHALQKLDPDFNRELAEFLATQAWPLAGIPQ